MVQPRLVQPNEVVVSSTVCMEKPNPIQSPYGQLLRIFTCILLFPVFVKTIFNIRSFLWLCLLIGSSCLVKREASHHTKLKIDSFELRYYIVIHMKVLFLIKTFYWCHFQPFRHFSSHSVVQCWNDLPCLQFLAKMFSFDICRAAEWKDGRNRANNEREKDTGRWCFADSTSWLWHHHWGQSHFCCMIVIVTRNLSILAKFECERNSRIP